jgi:CrcB protein
LAWSPSEEMRAFLAAGVLGAFTTFSTFSMDTVVLWERGEFVGAGIYVVCSVALGVCGLIAGMSVFRAILT